jgi:hypothetical protein
VNAGDGANTQLGARSFSLAQLQNDPTPESAHGETGLDGNGESGGAAIGFVNNGEIWQGGGGGGGGAKGTDGTNGTDGGDGVNSMAMHIKFSADGFLPIIKGNHFNTPNTPDNPIASRGGAGGDGGMGGI